MRIGVVAKVNDNVFSLISDILSYGSLIGIDVFIESRLAEVVRWDKTFVLGKDRLDYLIVIGGDGTILSTLLALGDNVVPMVTIRSGKRAFLYDSSPDEIKDVLSRLVRGDYVVKEYMRLEATCSSGVRLPSVLNEYVLATSGFFRSKVAHLRVFKKYDSNGLDEIYTMLSDGLLVSTPIGSTAYNVSVGGPLVDPDLEALILTPIAPLNLFIRPVVLPSDSEVVVEVCRDSLDVDVIADGTFVIKLGAGDSIRIRKSSSPAKFVRFHRLSYGKTLQRLFYER